MLNSQALLCAAEMVRPSTSDYNKQRTVAGDSIQQQTAFVCVTKLQEPLGPEAPAPDCGGAPLFRLVALASYSNLDAHASLVHTMHVP